MLFDQRLQHLRNELLFCPGHHADLLDNLIQGYTPAGYLFSASYDAENRLVELSYTDSDGLLHSKLYAYTWNDLLAQIQSYENGALVDDLRIVRAGFLPLQDRDGNNAVVRDYLWGRNGGGGIGGLLSMRTGGEDYYYHYDGRGNVTSVTDSTQQKVAEYTYTDYGNINNQSGSLSQPFRFSTKRLDEETGLIYFGYRYYVPGSRKWLTRDPIEEAGGVNLYGYVHGNPINYTDPHGDFAHLLIGAVSLGLSIYDAYNTLTDSCLSGREKFDRLAADALIGALGGKLIERGLKGVRWLGGVPKSTVKPGEFSISDWSGYPAGVPKPQGPFKLLEGAEYDAARKAANKANNQIRIDNNLRGQAVDVHEIKPVKFDGSATDPANKIILDRNLHRQQVTPWWNQLQKDLGG